jgi:maltose O-acetyltransferase
MKRLHSILIRVKRVIREIYWQNLLSSVSGRVSIYGPITIENPGNVTIGYGTSINANTYISGHDSVIIGKHCSLSAGCMILTAYLDKFSLNQKFERDIHLSKAVKIGDYTQIGAGAIILPGVSIGDRTIVGAGSVVTKDIPSDCVCYGSPARPLKIEANVDS